jgi:putative membrane protein
MTDANASARRAKTTAITAAIVGLFVATAVIGYFNFGSVLSAIRPIGVRGFLLVIAAQVVLFVPLGIAWLLVAPPRAGPAGVFIFGRLTREAASDVLPFSQVGGLMIAARAAVLGGVSTAAAFGSSVVDITVEIAGQIIYTLVGVALLVHRLGFGAHDNRLLLPLLGGMAIAVLVVVGLVATQRRGLNFLDPLLRHLVPAAAHQTAEMAEIMDAAYDRRVRLALSLILHVLAWFGAAVGTWLILDFIGHPLPFLSVVAIESLLFAIRNAAFVVPSGLGVQEGAYALLGPLFGLPVEAALALSLVKRARDIAVGVPVLLIWQLLESRRRLREG